MLHALFPFAAFASTCAGAVCIYLGAPRQQWLNHSWPVLPSRLGGLLLLLTGLLLRLRYLHPVTALFAMLASGMMLFIAIPYLAAFRRVLKGEGN